MNYKVMEYKPTEHWVLNLRKGNVVWLIKQETFAKIAYPYEIEPGHVAGDVGLEISPGHIQKWFIRSNGNGFDNKSIIWPVENNVPENPLELPPNDIRRLNREIELLSKRVDDLHNFFIHLDPY